MLCLNTVKECSYTEKKMLSLYGHSLKCFWYQLSSDKAVSVSCPLSDFWTLLAMESKPVKSKGHEICGEFEGSEGPVGKRAAPQGTRGRGSQEFPQWAGTAPAHLSWAHWAGQGSFGRARAALVHCPARGGDGSQGWQVLTVPLAAPGVSCTPPSLGHLLALSFAVITPLLFQCKLLPNKQSTPHDLLHIGPSFATSALRFGLLR